MIFKIAARLQVGASDEERNGWLRSLLFFPCLFKCLHNKDAIYAEANSLRHDIMVVARVVTHSARQLVYNIQGFKAQLEKGGKTDGAKDIAKFWVEHVRSSEGQEHMTKPGTIDACLTSYNRLFRIPECVSLLQESESIYGEDGPWS